ncbi:MAG: diacylglycerol kinase family lipid kinase [Chloroflexi bacterium]|nr:diacylglycerol kinase family lipid kinase [Chloroflexota bacterium]
MAKTIVILNPISGHHNGEKVWQQIETALRAGGLAFDLARTTAPRAAVALAENARRSGYETIISVGGDGTVSEVVNGMMRASKSAATGTLGVISVGSGNDFVKSFSPQLGVVPPSQSADWRAGVARVLAGETRVVDVGRVIADHPAPGFDAPHYFVNSFDTGFGAHAAMHAHDFRFLRGMPMYLAAVLKTLAKYSLPRVKMIWDDAPIEQTCTMIAVANGRCIGGGFWVAPDARNDDGVFDVMIAQGLGRLGILSLLPKVMRGTHIYDSRVRYVKAARIVIESRDPLVIEADGEIPFIGARRAEIEILPQHLRVLA